MCTGIRVYNDQFDVIVEYNLREMNGGTESFVNDVVVTETAAYFTGALEQIIYTVSGRAECIIINVWSMLTCTLLVGVHRRNYR